VKFSVKIIAFVDCKTEAEAVAAAKEIDGMLAKPYVSVLLAGKGVKVMGYKVEPKPEKIA